MQKFEMQAQIIMETKEEIAKALRDIASAIERGEECGTLPGELQCMEWYCGEENSEDDDYMLE